MTKSGPAASSGASAAIDWLSEARRIQDRLAEIRRAFHRDPELGNREFHTSDRIIAVLSELGIPCERVCGTGVCGRLLLAGRGKAAGLRADMDALPVEEKTGAGFVSQNAGVMHACGHDVHMTAALGAAMLLSAHRNELAGEVRFLFQPDEEGSGGARRMIEAGCADGLGAVFGMHVSPDLPAGDIGIRYGKFYAASDMFEIRVRGRGAHGATPEKGIDALRAACRIVDEISVIPDMFQDRCIITTGKLTAGTKENTVAESAVLNGIIRTLGPDMRSRTKDLVRERAEAAAAALGASAEVLFQPSYGGIVNTGPETQIAEEAAVALVGADRVHRIEEPVMTTEDFGCFTEKCSGSFYHIGAGCSLPLHSSGFLPSEDILPVAAAVHAAVLTHYLQ